MLECLINAMLFSRHGLFKRFIIYFMNYTGLSSVKSNVISAEIIIYIYMIYIYIKSNIFQVCGKDKIHEDLYEERFTF